MIEIRLALGTMGDAVETRLRAWEESDAVARLWRRDTTLWSEDPETPELANRLGWLDLPAASEALLPALDELRAATPFWMSDLVLLGMGGSSLAPEVLARTIGAQGLPLTLLDTTHPRAVRDLDWIHPANTIFVVASKSGTTLETLSLFRHFWSRAREVGDEPGGHFIAITDPGSALVEVAEARGFRGVFEAPADVGGRFSALSPFGLVPAALMGIDVATLLDRAREAAEACDEAVEHNPGFLLGAALGEAARAGRDKVTFIASPTWAAFPDWAEQLIAESTGKDGAGIVPVAHEPELDPEAYGNDRLFVGLIAAGDAARDAAQWGEEDPAPETLDALEAAGHPVVRIELEDEMELGALFFVWEVAVAMAGSALEIHPFDQPDVQVAKELAERAMAGEVLPGAEDATELDLAPEVAPYGHASPSVDSEPDVGSLRARVRDFVRAIEPADYVGIHAYLPMGYEDIEARLSELRAALTAATGAATTLGYGPRFLHSTGQLHKGGANNGAFLQIVDDAASHVHVPEGDFTFRQLVRAQARGDLGALTERGRRVLRIRVGPGDVGIGRLVRLIEEIGEETT
ncbi:MAG: hypothetical protein MJB57_14785 [Gemmatimonadetes bacterium]|nr:hypothetical protein [Gemmatimonadota bacterium]